MRRPGASRLPIYGPEQVVRAQMRYAKKKYAAIAGVELPGGRTVSHALVAGATGARASGQFRHSQPVHVRNARAQPCQSRTRRAAISAFLPSCRAPENRCSSSSASIARTFSKVSGGEDLGIIGPVYMTCWERTLVCLIMFPIGRDKERNAKIRARVRELGEARGGSRAGRNTGRRPCFRIWFRGNLLVQRPRAAASA